jgi:hypothetical protein
MTAAGEHLTPTQELVMDVLAARHRLGDTLWTFSSSAGKAVKTLAAAGLVNEMHGITENTIRASLTDVGRNRWLSPTYPLPVTHAPTRIWQERPGEFSYACACGLIVKHQRFGEWNTH